MEKIDPTQRQAMQTPTKTTGQTTELIDAASGIAFPITPEHSSLLGEGTFSTVSIIYIGGMAYAQKKLKNTHSKNHLKIFKNETIQLDKIVRIGVHDNIIAMFYTHQHTTKSF